MGSFYCGPKTLQRVFPEVSLFSRSRRGIKDFNTPYCSFSRVIACARRYLSSLGLITGMQDAVCM